MKELFKIWLFALGSFSDKKTKPYDKKVLVVRTCWVLLHVVTCVMIIIGNGRLLKWWQNTCTFLKSKTLCNFLIFPFAF